MKIKLKNTPEQVALIKALASNKLEERVAAQEAFAEFITEPILMVLHQVATLSSWFTDLPFQKYGQQTIPLDQYFDVKDVDYIRVWSQSMAGGLPTQFTHSIGEMPFTTYKLDSAVGFEKKYAAQARLDVVSNTLTRMAEEILLKQERNAVTILLRALAAASTDVKVGTNTTVFQHVIRSTTANQFQLHDFNRLFTLIKRIRSSWAGGTALRAQSRGLTDIAVSPEIVEFFRSMAYNPINTRAGVLSGTSGQGYTDTTIPATDAMREQIYNAAGAPSFFGVNVLELNELGVGYKWNNLFDTIAGSTTYADYAGTGGAASAFDGAAEEIVIGVDKTTDMLLRPVATDGDTGASFTVRPDDQFVTRQEKIGFYGSLEEGRIVLDERSLVGLIV